ncbi:unnamed protein product [Caenorhabditis nigoni]
MDLTSSFIKDNHRYLRTCILYEVLQEKPIFDSYKDFCKTVGQDAMNYPDFEYWYYRLYRGNQDLNYDRSADPQPKTIMDIPVGSLTKISEYLDPVERALLRSMNKSIKDVADSFPPVFEKICVKIADENTFWSWNDKSYVCYKDVSGCTLFRHGRNCSMEKSDECYLEKGLGYLTPLLKNPNVRVNHFSLYLFDEILKTDDLLHVPFHAKSLDIYGQTTNEVVQFLSAMTPGYLESISLNGSFLGEEENFRLIFETDQFKQANIVNLDMNMSFNVADLASFSHLKKFKFHVKSDNTVEDAKRIRDTISTFEEFESCELSFYRGWEGAPTKEFAEALGEEVPMESFVPKMTINHRYQIPGSNKCLEFKIKDEDVSCRIEIRKI